MNKEIELHEPVLIGRMDELRDRKPAHAIVSKTDLVLIKQGDDVSVMYGRCHHRGALLADGFVDGDNLICGLHHWDYRIDTGISEYNNDEVLHKFQHLIKGKDIYIDRSEILAFEQEHPSAFKPEEYLGKYADTHPEGTEPYTAYIKDLAQNGLKNVGHHGPMAAMGVDRSTLPGWHDLQFLPAQLLKRPLEDLQQVRTEVIIGPKANRPLKLKLPLFVSDMSFGALSQEAKISLSRGAELAGTGICSGEGGMLAEEQEHNRRYFYEMASARFGFNWDKLTRVQAFHFKGGQGAKTGTGGHQPGHKVTSEIAAVRGLKPGEDAISPAAFEDLRTPADFMTFAEEVRQVSGGIPVGFKLAASHIEADMAFALEVGADYIILDGRGGGTGAAPTVLRDNINVPTIPALARARKFMDEQGVTDVDYE